MSKDEKKEIVIRCSCQRRNLSVTTKPGETKRKQCGNCQRSYRVHHNTNGTITIHVSEPYSSEEHGFSDFYGVS